MRCRENKKNTNLVYGFRTFLACYLDNKFNFHTVDITLKTHKREVIVWLKEMYEEIYNKDVTLAPDKYIDHIDNFGNIEYETALQLKKRDGKNNDELDEDVGQYIFDTQSTKPTVDLAALIKPTKKTKKIFTPKKKANDTHFSEQRHKICTSENIPSNVYANNTLLYTQENPDSPLETGVICSKNNLFTNPDSDMRTSLNNINVQPLEDRIDKFINLVKNTILKQTVYNTLLKKIDNISHGSFVLNNSSKAWFYEIIVKLHSTLQDPQDKDRNRIKQIMNQVYNQQYDFIVNGVELIITSLEEDLRNLENNNQSAQTTYLTEVIESLEAFNKNLSNLWREGRKLSKNTIELFIA